MKKKLIKINLNSEEIQGKHTKIRGITINIKSNVSNITGDVSSIYGDVSNIIGNIDECEITDVERENGIYIIDLIKE